jgi:L-serine/L-threonine ammonia-lyase
MIHEITCQIPDGVTPDAIFCKVGGGGLLGGVLREVIDPEWDRNRSRFSLVWSAYNYLC